MKILSVIIARGGSKGVPRKNVAEVGGIPLVAHIIKSALAMKITADLVLSTEDEKVACFEMEYGGEVHILCPVELAEDHVTFLLVGSVCSRSDGKEKRIYIRYHQLSTAHSPVYQVGGY